MNITAFLVMQIAVFFVECLFGRNSANSTSRKCKETAGLESGGNLVSRTS